MSDERDDEARQDKEGGKRRRRRRRRRGGSGSGGASKPRGRERQPDDAAAAAGPSEGGEATLKAPARRKVGASRRRTDDEAPAAAASDGGEGKGDGNGGDRGKGRPKGRGEGRGPRGGRRPEGKRRDDLPETAFEQFDLPRPILDAIADAGYLEPTEVQERLIPWGLEGRDVVARSRTGTGKTCAFLAPTIARLEEARSGETGEAHGPPRILVVVPTRELARQVAEESERLCRFLSVRTVCVYGGTRLQGQMRDLPRSAVVVGTPGRLLDHIGRRTFDTSSIDVLVLDEVDRMYDLGFREDVDRLLAATSGRSQTILVSATLNEDVEDLIAKHLGEHERILVESKTMTVEEVDQTFYVVQPDRKRELLKALFAERDTESAIVFTRTKFTADRVAYALQKDGLDAHEIHSGLPQRRREQILGRFRDGKLAILVATDVAARGLDIEGVDHVINYDIPENPEDYVHRVGRTARMGQEGWAVTFVCPDDGRYLTQIEKLINKQIDQKVFPGFEIERPDQAPAEEKKAAERIPGVPRWARPKRRRR